MTAARPKVGVLTFHRCINYGSYWQAKCLVDGLRDRGMDAVLLDHRSPSVNFSELRCAMRPTMPVIPSRSDRQLYGAKVKKFESEIARLPLSSPFDIDEPSAAGEYDVVVVGSDEVWNLHHPWYGSHRIFYGEGLATARLVSYAASFGNYPAAHGLDADRCDLLRRFGYITVRDENSSTLVTSTTGLTNQMVLDPCLQFADERTSPSPSQSDLVLVYGHSFSPEFARNVRAWADRSGARLISVGYRNEWADDQWLDAGPSDLYELFERARGVVTNFFHGCVFAIRNALPFICEESPYRSNKVRGLTNMLGCKHRLVDADSNTDSELLDTPLEDSIFDRLSELRTTSNAALNQALFA